MISAFLLKTGAPMLSLVTGVVICNVLSPLFNSRKALTTPVLIWPAADGIEDDANCLSQLDLIGIAKGY